MPSRSLFVKGDALFTEQDPKALAGESADFFVSNTGADIAWAHFAITGSRVANLLVGTLMSRLCYMKTIARSGVFDPPFT
jgi:hypothetical protein